MRKKSGLRHWKYTLISICITTIFTSTLTFVITRTFQIEWGQVLTINNEPFNRNNFLVDVEAISRELNSIGINTFVDRENNNFVLIPRSVDLRHTTELMLWGNWLNANYGGAFYVWDGEEEVGVLHDDNTIAWQFLHTVAMGAYSFIRRVVDERGPYYADLYSGTYWIDANNVLHLHYRFLIDHEGEILELLDLHQSWHFAWAYQNALNIWQYENPEHVIQIQRVGLP